MPNDAGTPMAHMMKGRRIATPTPSILPDLGTTEHGLLMLVLVELGILIVLRRVFRNAHGG